MEINLSIPEIRAIIRMYDLLSGDDRYVDIVFDTDDTTYDDLAERLRKIVRCKYST